MATFCGRVRAGAGTSLARYIPGVLAVFPFCMFTYPSTIFLYRTCLHGPFVTEPADFWHKTLNYADCAVGPYFQYPKFKTIPEAWVTAGAPRPSSSRWCRCTTVRFLRLLAATEAMRLFRIRTRHWQAPY